MAFENGTILTAEQLNDLLQQINNYAEIINTIQSNLAILGFGSSSLQPGGDNAISLGLSAQRFSQVFAVKHMYTATTGDFCGTGSPEGVLAASPSSTYRRTDGPLGSQFYLKQTGTGNTGWTAIV